MESVYLMILEHPTCDFDEWIGIYSDEKKMYKDYIKTLECMNNESRLRGTKLAIYKFNLNEYFDPCKCDKYYSLVDTNELFVKLRY